MMDSSSNNNGKISDSGYTNTCVSQSQRSSGSSLSRNNNHSDSSGYCGGQPLAFDSGNYALPQPISRRDKDRGHKKKKSNQAGTTTCLANVENKLGTKIDLVDDNDHGAYDTNGSSSDFTSNDKKSEIGGVDLVDDTGLGEQNGDSNSTEPEIGVGTITNPLDDTTSNANSGFCAVISMKKGLVIDVTSTIKTALGYTRESWINRSFIEFVHPKDKQTFADHLGKNMALPYGDDRDKGHGGERQTSMFCSLQKNAEGRTTTDSSASDESNALMKIRDTYLPFHLTMGIKFFRERTIDDKPRIMLLTVNAEPILPIYRAPEEMIISAIFSTRHDSSCILTHVDLSVVKYLGYMPQDMIGHSLFDFYHPEDLPFIKDVYETVVKMEGSPFRSKPYRFAAHNGDYVLLETDWSSFVNPWREKLEFVVGHHRVLRGPTNPNVFQMPGDRRRILFSNISEEIFKESKIIQGEIQALLNEKIKKTEDNEESVIRSNDLEAFVENLLREVKPPAPVSKEHLTTDGRHFLAQDSAILGSISPHHEYCDSKSSTETPPSYGQLNYNDKITRFFDSKLPATTPYGSDEDNMNSSIPSNEDPRKTSSNVTGLTKDTTLSAENLSRGSNNRTSYDSRADSDNPTSHGTNTMPIEDLKIPILTESVLKRHNQEMEKLLVQQHKEWRCTIKNNSKNSKDSRKKGTKEESNKHGNDQTMSRGAKRQSTEEREEEYCKVPKYDKNPQMCNVAPLPAMTKALVNADDKSSLEEQSMKQKSKIWPSLVATASPQLTHPHPRMVTQNNGIQEASACPGYSSFLPIYYVSLPQIRGDLVRTIVPQVSTRISRNDQSQRSAYVSYARAPLAGVIYPPMVCAPAPVTTMYRPFVIPGPVPIHRETPAQSNTGVTQQKETSSDRIERPASQATSIKAEPGSTMAMSESSKKLFSLGEHFSSCPSVYDGCSSLVPKTKLETNTNSEFDWSPEDSSDSSFYGSFLTTSNESSRNQNSKMTAVASQKPAIVRRTGEDRKQLDMLRKGPPWQEGVKMTRELVYQYQLTPRPLNEVLEADMRALKNFNQPQMVNDQLAQLYSDMELGDADCTAIKLALWDDDASSNSESDSSGDNPRNIMPELHSARNEMSCATMSMMIYEGNASLLLS